jgi:helicase
MKITDLASYGYPLKLISIWEQEGSSELLPLQIKAIEEYHIFDEGQKNLLVIAPTSSGKTFIGEIMAVREAIRMKC